MPLQKPRANNDIRDPSLNRATQGLNERRIMLAVAVELHDQIIALALGELITRLQGHAVAHVERMRDHQGPSPTGQLWSAVLRAIVDHQDIDLWQMPPNTLKHTRQAAGLVVSRDDDQPPEAGCLRLLRAASTRAFSGLCGLFRCRRAVW